MTITEKYQNITGYDIGTFISDFSDFVSNDYQNIIDYYEGNSDNLSNDSFSELNRLVSEYETVNETNIINRKRFNTVDYWELIEDVDTIGVKLNTIERTAKWVRSSVINTQFNQNLKVDKVLGQGMTIESTVDQFGSDNKDADWYEAALDNKLREEDYSLDGGNLLTMEFRNNFRFLLDTVVDNLVGEKVYGLDIQKQIAFEGDDIKTLSYKDTISQSFDILMSIQKGDIPEFTQDGLNTAAIVGSNANSVSYPYIFRQLFSTFSKDDTFKSLSINKIERVNDRLSIEFQAKTRLDEIVNENITI